MFVQAFGVNANTSWTGFLHREWFSRLDQSELTLVDPENVRVCRILEIGKFGCRWRLSLLRGVGRGGRAAEYPEAPSFP
jgi:hypothetical protein